MLAAAGVFVLRAAAQPAPPRRRRRAPAPTGARRQPATPGDSRARRAGHQPPDFEDLRGTLTTPAPTRVVVNERDRAPLERRPAADRRSVQRARHRRAPGHLARRRAPGATPRDPWQIAAVSRLSIVTGLYRLSLNTAKQYDIHNLTVHAPDLAIEMTSGRAFVAETPEGPTALVLLGPRPDAIHPAGSRRAHAGPIFGGAKRWSPTSTWRSCGFLPASSRRASTPRADTPRAVNPRICAPRRRSSTTHVGESLQVDLGDLSRDRWSLAALVRRRHRRTAHEEIRHAHVRAVRQRTRRTSRSSIASSGRTSRSTRQRKSWRERGRFYSEDERLDYDVLAYDIDARVHSRRGTDRRRRPDQAPDARRRTPR